MSDQLVQLSDENFEAEVVQHPGAVLVDFWAPWCGPCRMVAPIVEQLAGEYADRVKVCKLNTDEAPETATRYGIRSIPTLLIFNGGKVAEQIVGAVPKDHITQRLDGVLT